MSAKHKTHNHSGVPVHEDVAYEPRDVQSAGVLKFLQYLALTIAVTLLVCWGVWTFTRSRVAGFDPAPPPMRQNAPPIQPPEPRLQAQGFPDGYHNADPQQDYRDKIERDREALEKTGWVDERAGVAQIPIEDAMKILAQRGLPATPPQRGDASGARPKP